MNHAIIVAAGKGTRMNSQINKIFLPLNEKPLLYYSVKPFEDSELIDDITIVCGKLDIDNIREVIGKFNFKKVKRIIEGGKERQDSVYNGAKALDANDEDVVIVEYRRNSLAK